MKVLILSANTGEGHNSAARAIAEKLTHQGADVTIQNGLVFMPKLVARSIEKGHGFTYRKLPKLFGFFYNISERVNDLSPYRKNLDKLIKKAKTKGLSRDMQDLKLYIEEFEFDAVICVHVFPAKMVSILKEAGYINIPVYFLATDYNCSPDVNQIAMDKWFIAHERLIPEFTSHGIPEDRLLPTGIPVNALFKVKQTKEEARKELGYTSFNRIVLLSCGSMGASSLGRTVLALSELLKKDTLLIAVCGKNRRLEKSLRHLIHKKNVIILGFTYKMPTLLSASDLYITKPGGLSTTEAANKGVPMVFINSVPGLETHNLKFFSRIGCAVPTNGSLQLIKTVSELIYDDARLKSMRDNCVHSFDTDAAQLICDAVIGTGAE